ncbi:MAG: sigma 54-interacting transcriptional regulator [Pseudomonadota bacterium]
MSQISNEEPFEELAMAALFENEFSIDWIQAITGDKPSRILGLLEKEVENGALSSKGWGKYLFHNEKRKQELRRLLPRHEQEFYHRRIVEVLQREVTDEKSVVQEIAAHLMEISNDVEGCRWLYKAARENQRAFRYNISLIYYTKIVEDLFHVQNDEADILFMDSAMAFSKNSTARINPAKVIDVLENALRRAEAGNDKRRQALIEMHLAKNEWLRGNESGLRVHYRKGEALADNIDDERLHLSLLSFRIWYYNWRGRYKDVVTEYQKHAPDIDRYPTGRFPMITSIILSLALVYCGKCNQGLGMLNALYNHCLKIGDIENAAVAEMGLGFSLIAMRKLPEALRHCRNSLNHAKTIKNEWVATTSYLGLSFIHCETNQMELAKKYLNKCYQSVQKTGTVTINAVFYLEILWGMKKGNLARIPGLNLENEIDSILKGPKNPLLKGVAFRRQALLRQSNHEPDEAVEKSLRLSKKYLDKTGHQTELALTGIELARLYFRIGDRKKAVEWAAYSAGIVDGYNKSIIPDDLKGFIKEHRSDKDLLKEILALGQDIMSIRANRDLVNNVLATANRLTGAERGAIFLLNKEADPPCLYLIAARNLTPDDVNDPSFAPSMKMIEETAWSKQKKLMTIEDKQKKDEYLSRSLIQSSICVPMMIRGELIGVLYHDNRLFAAAFQENDLEILSYFASQAAIALDNAKAYAEIKNMSERLEEEKRYYEEQHFEEYFNDEIIGKSPAIKKVIAAVDQVAGSDATVLILGETGVGKELVVNSIHRHSPRCDKPLIRVHCSALPESLISSELFGHEKGSFTGAVSRRMGRFELADGGAIFLDEIGELPPEIQVRLLRVLQTKEFERVGGVTTLHSDFRLIAATNRDLKAEVKSGRFREDLYYRLNVFPIEVPPLRRRSEDIPLLAQYLLKIYSNNLKKNVTRISPSVMEELIAYSWPGNVRELENVIERGVILSSDSFFRMPPLISSPLNRTIQSTEENIPTFKENERVLLLKALEKTGWKISGKGGAAELLDMNRNTLAYRMKILGIKKKGNSCLTP